jgi:hypothetical protein
MEKKTQYLERLDAAHANMQAELVDIDVHMEIYPGWTIKHVLAHIAGWDDASTMRAHANGSESSVLAAEGIDAYNAQSVATRETLAYEQVAREWELAREQLKSAIDEMPPQKLEAELLFPWGRRGTIAQLVAILANHEDEHAHEIQALKARARETGA